MPIMDELVDEEDEIPFKPVRKLLSAQGGSIERPGYEDAGMVAKEGLGYDVGMDDESYDVRLLEDLEDEDAKRRMIRAIMMEARLKTPEGDRVLQDTVDTASQNLMMMGIGSGDEDMFNRRMADVEDRMAQRTDPMLFRAQGGIADLDMRGGGASFGPGTGTSDDVPAMLSDGEFVMTANAVRNLGGGDRMVGAKRMYNMMNQLDPNSQSPGEMNVAGYG